jgi:hypothetical protein
MGGSGPSYSTTIGPFSHLTVPDNTTRTVSIVITARDQEGNQATASVSVRVHSLSECFG